MVSILSYLVILFSASIGNATAVEVSPASWGIDVQQVATGRKHSCAILDGGSLFCWGDNSVGQCAALSQFAQVDLGTGRTAKQVATGSEHTCVLLDNDKIKCFGANGYGNLGIGDTTNRGTNTNDMGDNLPYVDMGPGRWVKQVSTGSSHTCVLLDNNQVKCFGSNYAGQLGLGDDINRGGRKGDMGRNLPFVNIGKGRTVKAITTGLSHTCVLLDDDRIKCFGDNQSGELGLGDRKSRGKLARNMGDNLPYVDLGTNRTAKQISAGGSHTCVLLENNQVKCFGSNIGGELGLGDTFDLFNDLDVNEMGDRLPFVDVGTGRTVKHVTAGSYHTCVLLDNNQVKCFGENSHGQLGLGESNNRGDDENEMGDNLPQVDLGTGVTVKQIVTSSEHTCALLDNNRIKCFGANNYGQLGLGDTHQRGSEENEMGDLLPFVDVGFGRKVKQVTAGHHHTCVLLDSNQVKCIGSNAEGEAGLGGIVNRGTGIGEMSDKLPYVQVGRGRTVQQVTAGGLHTCVLLDNQQIKCFGSNSAGNLGLGDVRHRGVGGNDMGDILPFVDVGHTRKVMQIAAGYFHTCVLLDNHQLKCFGRNQYGQLGIGDQVNRGDISDEMGDNLMYVDLGLNKTAKHVAAGLYHTCVILDNDQVKCFGRNEFGQLGLGDRRSRGDGKNETGDNEYEEYEVTEEYEFGDNEFRVKKMKVTELGMSEMDVNKLGGNEMKVSELGENEVEADEMGDNLPFVNVGTNRTVKQVVAGDGHTCVLLDNKQVKCFGNNELGQLGLGNQLNRGDDPNDMGDNLPYVDVGQERTVKQVAAGSSHTCVLLDNNQVKCFGYNASGQLGIGDQLHRGDEPNEMGDNLPFVDVGPNRSVKQVVAGGSHTCVLLDNDHVKCFGYNEHGQLGLGDSNSRSSPPTFPISFGFRTVSLPGSKLSPSQTSASLCQIGEYQPLSSQQSCLSCPVGQFQDNIGSASCSSCLPGTFSNQLGSSSCTRCLTGTYEDEFGSTRCKSCPSQRTTLRDGASHVDACVAATGFMLLPPNDSGVEIQPCNNIVGADCSSPGATLEQLALECGYWRPNPSTTELILECSGGCDSCHGGNVGDWSTNQFEYSTKYCADGYRGPRCTLCAEGFANVFRNDTCIECDDSQVLHARNALRTEIVVWCSGLLLATAFFILGLWVSHKRQLNKQSTQSKTDIKAKRWLYLSWFGIAHSAGSVTMIAISFYQVFNAYIEEFRELDNMFNFDIDPFSTALVTHECVWNPSYRERLAVHTFLPLCLGVWVLIVGKAANLCYQDQDVRDKNSSVAAFVALLPAILAYPSVQRRAVSAFVCEEFVIGPAANTTVRLLVADMRQNCDDSDHFVSEVLAVVCIVLYTILVVGVFAVAATFSDPDSNQLKGKRVQFSLLRRMLVSPFRSSNKTGHHTLAWFLAYDTLRKFFQASLIVFFGRGTRLQVALSIILNFVAIVIAFKSTPYRLDGTNEALLIQLYLLTLVCVIVGSSELSVPLDDVRELFIIIIAGALVPLMAICCWIHNLWKFETALRQVQRAMKLDSEEETKSAYDQAITLGLKPSHECVLRVVESKMKSRTVQERNGTCESMDVFKVGEGNGADQHMELQEGGPEAVQVV